MWALNVWATLSLSVTPFEGGSDLRFGRVDSTYIVNKEVKVRVTTTGGTQYQIFQRLLEPLVNEYGVPLNSDALTAYTIRGSNIAGTLYQEETPMPLSFGDQLLYTSNPNGDSDSLQLIYTIQGARLNTSGNFYGRILYTVRPIGEGEEKTYILEVFLDAAGQLHFEIEGPQGRDRIQLGTETQRDLESYITFSFEGNLHRTITVNQEVYEVPRNEKGEELDIEALKFYLSGGTNGEISYATPTPLERGRLSLYSSQSNQDSFYLNFVVDQDKIAHQKAGLYRGKLLYEVSAEEVLKTATVDIEVEITPIFELELVFPPEGMHFSDILPTTPPQQKEIEVIVKSNLGIPYMVMQNMNALLTNEKGEEIPSDYFTLKQALLDNQSGTVEFPEFSPVRLGDIPVFFSDRNGSSAKFKVIYRLKPYPQIHAGDYSTMMSFSLAQM